jgi:DNA-3-methyladenine glycosylase II
MATATKTPAKRAASQTGAAAEVQPTRARSGNAAKSVSSGNAVKSASPSEKVAVSDSHTPAKHTLNGASGRGPKARGNTALNGAKSSKTLQGNGAVPADLDDNATETARDPLHEVETGRRLRGSSAAEVVAPAPDCGLTREVIRPPYWDKACADLVKRDRILKKLIPKFGPVHLMSRDDPFVTLARSIVGQQISIAAAQEVWHRIEDACPKRVPQQFIKLGCDKLVACGLSKRKAEYILDLAQHFVSGALHVGKWTSMEDEAVIAELTQIRGIARWTAEMFLIFNLSRPDVLPLDDLGLIRAIGINYFSGEPVTRSEAREVAANWEPWRTVATWYMWRSLDPLPGD